MTTANSFGAARPQDRGRHLRDLPLDALEKRGLAVARLPYSLRILLENLLRREDGRTVAPAKSSGCALGPEETPDDEIAFMPAASHAGLSPAFGVVTWPPCATRCSRWAATEKGQPLLPPSW